MKKIKLYALCFIAAVAMFGCDKYDDTELKKDVNDLKSRIEKLEIWCNTINGQISALQGIVSAMENKDFVTGVTPIMGGTEEVGYTITFTQSKPITIMHGKDGAKGDKGDQGVAGKDAVTPIIGVKLDSDGYYYWTFKVGTAAATWILDDEGNKIRTTGDKGDKGDQSKPGEDGKPGQDGNDGHSPVLSVAEFEGCLYWQIDGQWLLHNGEKVPATGDKGQAGDKGDAGEQGPQGDAIFAENGIDYTSDPENVIFTLADGTTKITVPKASTVTVGFDSYEVFMGSAVNNEITLELPATLKETDYTAIVATVTNENGAAMDIQTRPAVTTNRWGVKVTKPTFGSDGKLVAGSAKVTLTAPDDIKLAETAMIEVTITDKNGKQFSVARPVKYFDGQIVECTAGGLNAIATNPTITKLAIKGSINQADFTYIKNTLTALEVLDISMTNLTSIPDQALAFYDPLTANNTLKHIVIPASVTSIGTSAFANCQALESFNVENATSLGQWTFENCYKLRSVKLGNKLTTINNSAFRYCTSLTSLDIPSSVTNLGRWVFGFCENLETITLHEGLQTLSESTFNNCGIISIRIPSTVTAIPKYTFEGCQKLERVAMHDDITDIDNNAFYQCYSLKSIKIPAGVTVIKERVFNECKNLQFVTFHDAITEIQLEAFMKCLSLIGPNTNETIYLPTSLETLGERAFAECTSLRRINMKQTDVETMPDHIFNMCEKLDEVSLPNNLKTIGQYAFNFCPLNSIELPASLASIGDYAFSSCDQLKAVTSYAITAPALGAGVFNSNKTGRILNIPVSSATNYTEWSIYFERTFEVLN